MPVENFRFLVIKINANICPSCFIIRFLLYGIRTANDLGKRIIHASDVLLQPVFSYCWYLTVNWVVTLPFDLPPPPPSSFPNWRPLSKLVPPAKDPPSGIGLYYRLKILGCISQCVVKLTQCILNTRQANDSTTWHGTPPLPDHRGATCRQKEKGLLWGEPLREIARNGRKVETTGQWRIGGGGGGRFAGLSPPLPS